MAWLEPRRQVEGGRGHLRASHADREHAIGTLKAAYAYGLVTKDEFDARVGQTLAARTYAELAVITADIPAGLTPAPPPLRPAPATADHPAEAKLGASERAVVGTAVLAGLLMIAAFIAGGNGTGGLLALGATGTAFVSMILAAAHVLSSRRSNRSGDQPPPAAHPVSSAAPAAQLPHSSKPRRPGSAEASPRHSLRPQVSG